MAKSLTITVDLDKRCEGCGKKGATQCGYCLRCVAARIVRNIKDTKRKQAAEAAGEAPC